MYGRELTRIPAHRNWSEGRRDGQELRCMAVS